MEFLKANMDYFIFGILVFMFFVLIFYFIERLIFFYKINLNSYKNQEELDNSLSENMTFIYIIYSNAPYVGLFGTIISIMIIFYDMSFDFNTKEIILGLSFALKATACGIFVAIFGIVFIVFCLEKLMY